MSTPAFLTPYSIVFINGFVPPTTACPFAVPVPLVYPPVNIPGAQIPHYVAMRIGEMPAAGVFLTPPAPEREEPELSAEKHVDKPEATLLDNPLDPNVPPVHAPVEAPAIVEAPVEAPAKTKAPRKRAQKEQPAKKPRKKTKAP